MGLPKMKAIKRIGLFLLISCVMFCAGSYVTLKAEKFFYPNKYVNEYESPPLEIKDESQTVKTGDNAASGSGNESAAVSPEAEKSKAEENDEQDSVIEAAVSDISVIDADTVYMVGEINLSDGTINEKEEAIPVKYIGLDREELISELDEYNNNPPLAELKKGFTNIELSAFSKDRVVVCKYYLAEEEEDGGFYLMVADHFVVVYKEDKQTIYMNTDILLENLSVKLQEEIIAGKYIESEEELYNFLESYSS